MSRHDEEGFFAAIGRGAVGAGCAVILFPLIAISLSAYTALFYLPLWRWFVVPLGAPDLGFWRLVGLFLLARSAMPATWIKPEFQQPFSHILKSGLVNPALTLGAGAIIHFWLM